MTSVVNANTGSIPVLTATSKRYSTVFESRPKEWFRRMSTARVGHRGIKGLTQSLPVVLDVFNG